MPGVGDGARMLHYGGPAAKQPGQLRDAGKTLAHGTVGDIESLPPQHLDTLHDGGGVEGLMVAEQLARDTPEQLRVIDVGPGGEGHPYPVGKHEGRTGLAGLGLEYREGLRVPLAYHHRDAGLDDSGLLECNLCQGIAQQCGVVGRDIGDDTQHRGDDVGAVEASSQPGLDDGHVHLLVGKAPEGHSRCQLEETWRQTLGAPPHPLADKLDHALLGHLCAVDAYALAEIEYVRRCVEPCPVSRRAEYGGERVGCRALAVCPRYVDAGIAAVRMSEHRVERL